MVKLLLDVINHVPTLAPVLMVVWMIMRMVGPVAMIVRVHSACWWQLLRAMGMLSIYMIWMIVSKPAIFGVIVSNQQAFAMMPAITEDIIVLKAVRSERPSSNPRWHRHQDQPLPGIHGDHRSPEHRGQQRRPEHRIVVVIAVPRCRRRSQ